MVRMYPKQLIATNSHAEAIMFETLESLGLEDAAVFHSYKFMQNTQAEEVDFILIHPIYHVILIEVKGCVALSYEHGKCTFRCYDQSTYETTRSPHTQANENRVSLFRELKFISTNLRVRAFVAFPQMSVSNVIEAPNSVMTGTTCYINECTNKDNLTAFLNEFHRRELFKPTESLTDTEMVGIIEYLKSYFKVKSNDQIIFDRAQAEITKLLKDNEKIINMTAHYNCISIEGVAGSGKTHLAMYAIDNLLKVNQFARINFFCRTNGLARLINSQNEGRLNVYVLGDDTYESVIKRTELQNATLIIIEEAQLLDELIFNCIIQHYQNSRFLIFYDPLQVRTGEMSLAHLPTPVIQLTESYRNGQVIQEVLHKLNPVFSINRNITQGKIHLLFTDNLDQNETLQNIQLAIKQIIEGILDRNVSYLPMIAVNNKERLQSGYDDTMFTIWQTNGLDADYGVIFDTHNKISKSILVDGRYSRSLYLGLSRIRLGAYIIFPLEEELNRNALETFFSAKSYKVNIDSAGKVMTTPYTT